FGEDKRGLFEFDFAKLPQIELKNKVISGTFEIRIAFSLEKDDKVKVEKNKKVTKLSVKTSDAPVIPVPNSKFELFAGFLVKLEISATVKVGEKGKINASIETVNMT